MVHFNITVSGKVQGVFYRQSALEKAEELGLKGFVRNESNGDVYIEAEGLKDQLDHLVAWCKKGPVRALVAEVKCLESEVKFFSSFEIQR